MAEKNKTKKIKGLGKGLDALFGDMEVSITEETGKKSYKDNAEKGNIQIKPSLNDETILRSTDETITKTKGEMPSSKKEPLVSQEVDNNEFTEKIKYIDINEIKPNATQPRKIFDEEKLEDLGKSIKEHGLIQPIVLRKLENGYEIVAGERRWRAARKIDLKKIPAIIRELSDEEHMLLAIIENMQREDLNPIEEAQGIHRMIETYGLTQEEVAKTLAKSRPYITNSIRLLKLPEGIKEMITEGKISQGHARAILSVKGEVKQELLAQKVYEEGYSVRQTEEAAKQDINVKRKIAKPRGKNANIKRVEEDLKLVLGTKVNLNQTGKKWKLEIELYSKEELERMIELIKGIQVK